MTRTPKLLFRRAGLALVALAIVHCSNKDDGTAIGSGDNGDGDEDIMLFGGGNDSTDGGYVPSGTDDYGEGDGGGADENACGELVGLGECGGSTQKAEFKDLNILLVIDKSTSMVDTPDGFEFSKWEALKNALGSALDNVKGQVSFGLELYPHSTTATPIAEDCSGNCCQVPSDAKAITVPIESGLTGVPKILDVLDETSPGGGTPTAAALERALQYFDTGDGADLKGERYVLLATDGGPNCNPDASCSEPEQCTPYLDNLCDGFCCPNSSEEGRQLCLDDAATEDAITALKDAGIKTFVVGIPGTEAYADHLNDFAVAGGATDSDGPEDYFAVTAAGGVEGLTSVFTNITTQLIDSCEVQLQTTPASKDLVNVAVDCEVVPQSSDGGGSSWTLDIDSDPATITLQGNVCNWIETRGAERVDVVFGCPTVR